MEELPNYRNEQGSDSSITSLLSSAITELIVLEPDYLGIGVPALELEKHLLEKDFKRFTENNVEGVLKREVDNGSLVKLENGNYFLGEHSNSSKQNNSHSSSSRCENTSFVKTPKTKKIKPKLALETFISSSDSSSTHMTSNCLQVNQEHNKDKKAESSAVSNFNSISGENIGLRVGGRQKRAKVMFDPSDNNLPKVSRKKPRGRPPLVKHMAINSSACSILSRSQPECAPVITASTSILSAALNSSTNQRIAKSTLTMNTCCFCHTFTAERLIPCSDCSLVKAHWSCIESRQQVRESKIVGGFTISKVLPWKCLVCMRRSVSTEGKVVTCRQCGDAYRRICHEAEFSLEVIKWDCAKCTASAVQDKQLKQLHSLDKMVEEDTTAVNNSDEALNCSYESSASADANPFITTDVSSTNCSLVTVNTNTDASCSSNEESAAVSAASTTNCPMDVADDIDDKDEEKAEPKLAAEPSDSYFARENTFSNKNVMRPPLKVNANCLSAVERGVLPLSCAYDPYEGYPIDESIPDITLWSPHEVFQYFLKYFGQDIARLFKDQEIDGRSLLLMKRSDLVSGSELKLGLALKVYSHVKKLQIRRSNLRLVWS